MTVHILFNDMCFVFSHNILVEKGKEDFKWNPEKMKYILCTCEFLLFLYL